MSSSNALFMKFLVDSCNLLSEDIGFSPVTSQYAYGHNVATVRTDNSKTPMATVSAIYMQEHLCNENNEASYGLAISGQFADKRYLAVDSLILSILPSKMFSAESVLISQIFLNNVSLEMPYAKRVSGYYENTLKVMNPLMLIFPIPMAPINKPSSDIANIIRDIVAIGS